MKNKITEYEVYACFGLTDVVTCDTLKKAIEIATKWSMESIDTDIAIEKVERTPHIKCFRNGGEVA